MSRKQRILKKRYAIFCEGDTEYNYTEKENFLKLLEYCRIQNDKGNAPIFVVADNPDFEYIACLHDEEYKGQDTKNYIVKTWGYKNLDAFKNDKDVYEFLNTGKRSFEKMLNAIRVQEKLVRNKYEIKKKTFEISIKSTEFNEDMLGRKVSNIEEFFDAIDW